MKARMRVLRLTPQAEARESWYATVFGDGREYVVDGASSSRLSPSKAAATSSAEPRPPTSKACAPVARTADPSPLLLVFGLCLSPRSSLPEPTVAMPELAARFGMNLSPAYDRVVLFAFWRRGTLRLVDAGVFAPVPTSVKSETPSSRARRGVCAVLAMFDLGESRCVLEEDFWKCAARFPPYVDLDARRLSSLDVGRSGVKGDELLAC